MMKPAEFSAHNRIFPDVTLVLVSLVMTFGAVNGAYSQTITVHNVAELHDSVNAANSSGGNTTILLVDGTYTLSNTLYISAPNVTIAGQSGNRESVVIQGDAMSDTANIGNLITVAASNFTVEYVTLQKSGNHLIQVKGEKNADSPVIRNCILRDGYEQLVKVSVDLSNTNVSSDNGLVENCLFEYTAGIGPQYYIGGIDAHSAKNWIVRNNTFRNIISPNTAVAEYAVHFWNDSADNVVEKNLIINCDRGIGFGLNSRGNNGGIIRNNMIYHASGRGQFADVGIAVHNSPGTEIYNNTIFMEHSYPSSIEYRFSGTTGVEITNNLTNRQISRIDGASGSESANVTTALQTWFIDASSGDLHLASQVSEIIDQGQVVSGLTDDFDSQIRPQGAGIDIGADEFLTSIRPRAPTDFQVN